MRARTDEMAERKKITGSEMISTTTMLFRQHMGYPPYTSGNWGSHGPLRSNSGGGGKYLELGHEKTRERTAGSGSGVSDSSITDSSLCVALLMCFLAHTAVVPADTPSCSRSPQPLQLFAPCNPFRSSRRYCVCRPVIDRPTRTLVSDMPPYERHHVSFRAHPPRAQPCC